MMQHKITERQLMALLAGYFGQPTSYVAANVYGPDHPKAGQPVWHTSSNAGGSVRRMADDLRERGYLTSYNRHEEWGDKSSYDLTVLGFEALQERLGKLPTIENIYGDVIYDFNEHVHLSDVVVRKEERRVREALMAQRRDEHRIEQKRAHDELRKKIERRQLERLRAILRDRGIGDNWSDQDVLAFHEEIASA
jgi:hypothetical protein